VPSRREVRRREERERARHEEAERARAASRRLGRLFAFVGGGVVLLAAIVVALVLVVGGGDDGDAGGEEATATAVASATAPPVPAIADDDLVKEEFDGIPQSGSYLGSPSAPYTLVEFGDLVCPPCATYSKDILPPVVEQFVREGKVRVQFQPINLTREQSALAGQYAWAASKQDKLWDFITLWYRNQGDEDVPYVNDDFARAIAEKIPGLDADRLITDAHDPETRRKLDDFAQRFVGLGFSVVPSFAAGPAKGTLRPLDLGEDATSATRAVQLLVETGSG
jgi:protein-disulfide isomerase